MRIGMKIGSAAMMVALMAGPLVGAAGAASGPSASGHGSLTVTDPDGNERLRQFSFSANTKKDGTVNGSAVIQNPAFEPKYHVNIDIQCLRVDGNVASIGGIQRNSNDPDFERDFPFAFFTVVDNGESGDLDTISVVFFDNAAPPSACLNIVPTDFPQNLIEHGNVQVRP